MSLTLSILSKSEWCLVMVIAMDHTLPQVIALGFSVQGFSVHGIALHEKARTYLITNSAFIIHTHHYIVCIIDVLLPSIITSDCE